MILTTTIGSFPKPSFLPLSDWFKGEKGTDNERPTSAYQEEKYKMGSQYESLVNEASKQVINDQIACGIDIVTDGEVRRENYIHYHCRHLKGIDFKILTEKTARTGNYNCWLPTITKKIEFNGYFLDKEFKLNQSVSNKPIKATIPGPLTIADTISDNFYHEEKKMCFDLGEVINKEIKNLVDAGCRYIQIDEPLFARKSKEALEFGIDNIERCFHGINNCDKIVHICCGYPDKIDSVDYPKAPLSSYFDLADALEASCIDTISIEDAHRYNDLKLLEKYKTKKIVFGLLKIASSQIEDIDMIRFRALDCLNHIDKERLIAAPDCGLGYLSRELAIKKLTNLCKAVEDI